MRIRFTNPILKIFNNAFIDHKTPSSLSYFWNFGSLLGLTLVVQIITGIFLAMHYIPCEEMAFNSVQHILRDVNKGFILKYAHANGASIFFICVYIHIGRGLYYGSYLKMHLWLSGVVLLLLMMLTAFIGYVLPWGQMSFWGATVITNFLSAIPYIGQTIVEWIWGGFSVSGVTLNRFFSLHYLFPFVLAGFTIVHLILLHNTGSSTPIGVGENLDNIPFHSYYITKDLVGFLFMFLGLSYLIFFIPNVLGDAENFIKANPMVTPVHIMPEWYFLFAYAILRAIPNKLGGVLALVASIIALIFLPILHSKKVKGITHKPLSKIFYWMFMANFVFLTWIGSKAVEDPFIFLGQISSLFYFFYLLILSPIIDRLESNYIIKT